MDCSEWQKRLYSAASRSYDSLTFASSLAHFDPVLGNTFMANTAQARKRARQAVKQNAHNSSQRSTLRTAIKAVRKAIEAGDKAAASQVFVTSISTIDRIADKKIIHKNKAARHKSRLAAALKALA
jgi:small subunit ribosomal protein S20